MSQININQTPPPRPPRRPGFWPIAVFVVVVALIIAGVVVARVVGQRQASAPRPTATPLPRLTNTSVPLSTNTPVPRLTNTSVPLPTNTPAPRPTNTPGGAPVVAPSATPGGAPVAPTNTPVPLATTTPVPVSNAPTATPAGSGAPTNPTSIRATNGTCGNPVLRWDWSGAQHATAYDVVLYNPTTGAEVRPDRTTQTYYEKRVAPGTTLALKVRALNGAGTARGYFTPGGSAVAHVPPGVTNPSAIVRKGTASYMAWQWYPAGGATGYNVIVYHYAAGKYVVDVQNTVTNPSFRYTGSPGTVYYIKVRSMGPCAPSGYFTPAGASAEHR